MAINKNLTFNFNHSDQADELFGNLTAQEIKVAFDSRGEDIRNYIYGVVDEINNNGAGHMGVQFHGVKSTMQNAIDTICATKVPYTKVGDIGDVNFETDSGYEYEVISRT